MSLPQTSLDLALWGVLEMAPEMPAWDAYGIARNVLQMLAIPEHLPRSAFVIREDHAHVPAPDPDPVAALWSDVL